ncbi:MAG: translocation/assembly module TamB domain-containing protein [bacterium]
MSRAKLRTLVIIFLLLAVAGVLAYVAVPRSFYNERARQLLLSYVHRYLGPEAAVEETEVSWRGIELKGVSLPLDTAGSQLIMESVTAHVNPLRAILSLGRLERSLGRITCGRPQLFIAAGDFASRRDTASEILPSIAVPAQLYSVLARLDTSFRISFDDGAAALLRAEDTLSLLSNFAGEFFCDAAGSAHLEAEGSFFGQPPRTVKLTARAQPKEQRLDAAVQLSFGEDIVSSLPVFRNVRAVRGKGSVRLLFSAKEASSRLSGDLDLTGLVAETADYGSFELSTARVRLQGDTLELSKFEGSARGCTFQASGQVVLCEGGTWDIEGTLRSLSIESFSDIFWSHSAPVSGRLQGDFAVGGELRNPEAIINLRGESAQFGLVELREIVAKLLLSASRLHLEQFAAQSDFGGIELAGKLSLSKEQDFAVALRGVFRPDASVPHSRTLRASRAIFELQGTLQNPRSSISVYDEQGATLLSGSLYAQDGGWQFLADDEDIEHGLWMYLRVMDEGLSARMHHGERLWTILTDEDLRERLKSFCDVSADLDMGRTTGRFMVDASLDSSRELSKTLSQLRRITLRGSYVRPQEGPLVLLGGFEMEAAQNLSGTFDIGLTADTVEIHQVRFADLAALSGRFLPKRSELEADLDIYGIPLGLFPLRSQLLEKGELSGTIAGHLRICGAVSMPEWIADLRLLDGRVFGMGNYWGTAQLSGTGSHCDVHQVVFGYDIERLFSASGFLDWGSDSVRLTAISEERAANGILRAVTGREGWLDGSLDARGLLEGRISSPTMHIALSVSHGSVLKDISFDTLSARFDWDFDNSGQRRIRISSARIEKFGRYFLEGKLVTNPCPGGRLSAEITGEGEFLCIVDGLTRTFHTQRGEGSLRARIGGTWDRPHFQGAELSLIEAAFTFPDLAPTQVFADVNVRLSPEGILEHGQVKFRSGSQYLILRTVRDSTNERYAGLEFIRTGNPALDLGIIEIVSGESGMPLRFPGFMAGDWMGNFIFGPPGGRSVTLSREEDHLLIEGDVALRNAMFTYPFLKGTGRTTKFTRWVLRRLKEARWNLQLIPEEGNHYYAEFTGLKDSELFASWHDSPLWRNFANLVDRLEVDAELGPSQQGVRLAGILDERSFHGEGQAISRRGRVNYLDQTFYIDEVAAEFDASDPRPVMWGRAETMGQDSLGRQIPVYLTLYVIDRETGIRARQGRLDDLSVVLESETESTPEGILALLGYTFGDMEHEALRMGGAMVERAFHSKLLRPVERRLERWMGLDRVSLEPTMQSRYAARRSGNGAPADTLARSFGMRYFTGSQLTAGKYLLRDLFFSYTGELVEGEEIGLEGKRLGLIHLWTIEYRIRPLSPDLVVDFSVEYDNLERKRDESVALKYSFVLEP